MTEIKFKRPGPPLIDNTPGKLPPQAPDLEQAVLGCILLEGRDPYARVCDFLFPEHMYMDAHRRIYEAIVRLFSRDIRADILTVTQEMRSTGDLDTLPDGNGPYYISQLTNKVASSLNIEQYARIILQKYIGRELIRDAEETMRQAYDETEDVLILLDKKNQSMAKINGLVASNDPVTVTTVLRNMVDDTTEKLFIPFYMYDLDKWMSIGPGQVVTVGGTPATGKTTFVLNGLKNMAMNGRRVAFFSLEMTKEQLVAKMVASQLGIDSERVTKNKITQQERDAMARCLIETHNAEWFERFFIMPISTLSSNQVYGMYERLVRRQKVDVVSIDYLQLMNGEGDGSTERMDNISKAIKLATLTTGVRTVNISQLNRAGTAATDPKMSNLRNSGQIEADSDIIMLLARAKGDTNLVVKIEKNKLGNVQDVTLPFDLVYQRIGYTPSFTPPPPTVEPVGLPYKDGDDDSDPPPF